MPVLITTTCDFPQSNPFKIIKSLQSPVKNWNTQFDYGPAIRPGLVLVNLISLQTES